MSKKKKAISGQKYLQLGLNSLAGGDTETAVKALRVAAADLPRNQAVKIALSRALRQAGDVGEAAIILSETLAIPPVSRDAAYELSVLLQRFQLDEPDDLKPSGLRAALSCDEVGWQPIVQAAFDWLKKAGALREFIAQGRQGGWDHAAALALCDRKGAILRDGLLRDALASGFNCDPEIEHFLKAIRKRLLLEIKAEDLLRNKDLFTFSLAIVAQCDINECVWDLSDEEQAALLTLAPDYAELAAGAAEAAPEFVKLLMYASIREIEIAGWSPEQVARLKPKALGALLSPIIASVNTERECATGIVRLSELIDDTSRRVAGQYEKSPYPRWSSLNTRAPKTRLDQIEQALGRENVRRYYEGEFDVLVAGCGTGSHAAQLSVAYGQHARILGVDLSISSLAYAQRMATHYNLSNLTFAQADLLNAKAIGRQFDIIECIGVLHHMADPFEGGRSVLNLLKPGGIMCVGLYSAIARKDLAALHNAPDYPGPGCDDNTARKYRATLFDFQSASGNTPFSASQNFYTLSDFRDLVLHESEQQLTLEEIGAFLANEGLAFSGFLLDKETENRFQRAFPDDPLPGRLENWAEFEKNNPKTFEQMYNFWCTQDVHSGL